LIISISPSSAYGIGIAPALYEVTDAFRGGEYLRTITVFNPDDNAKDFALRAEDEAGSWIKFYKIDDINTSINKISIGAKENKAFLAIIKIPLEEGVGKYNATIIAETLPENGTTSGSMSAVLQGRTRVYISITGDQVIDGEVNSIIADNSETGYPVMINTVFKNTGNVVVKPKIEITILKDNATITSFIHESTKVRPTSNEPIIVEWNTTSKDIPDDYKAKVVVSLDDRVVKADEVSFKILPVGTITRQGNLTSISIEGEPAIDAVAIVKAVFQNTGIIETPAKFSAEVYKDNKLIETLSSDELTVQKYKGIVLTSYLKIISPGKYLIKGKVIYSGKVTPVKEYSFEVSDNKSLPGFEASYAVFVILIFSIINRGKRRE
jgi:hypothetical protein